MARTFVPTKKEFYQKLNTSRLDLAYQADALLGEAPIWHPDRKSLFWVDIDNNTLYENVLSKKTCRKWKFHKKITTIVPESQDTVIIALEDEIIRFHLKKKEIESIALINHNNKPLRCNDGKCDPDGRLWIGTISLNKEKGTACLYMLNHNNEIKTRLIGLTNSNGLVWSNDKKYLYHIDTPTKKVNRYLYDSESGNIKYDRVAIKTLRNSGSPDGMTIDINGNLWIAQWQGSGVYCYDPKTGDLLTKINIPAPNTTACAFGGKNLETLYITTARSGLSKKELKLYPLSGSLFSCKPGVQGVESFRFGKTENKSELSLSDNSLN